jgi:hypothetical protein
MFRKETVGAQGAHHNNVMMKTEQGNSKAYTLERLKDERPDLFAIPREPQRLNHARTGARARQRVS